MAIASTAISRRPRLCHSGPSKSDTGSKSGPAEFPDKGADRLQRRLLLVHVRRMRAIRQDHFAYPPVHLPCDHIDLRDGAVLVILALDEENGTGYARQVRLDVPAAEIRMQPDVVPA